MKHFFYLLLLTLAVNCQKIEKNIIPDRLLSKDQMAWVLLDIAQIRTIKSNYANDLTDAGIIPNAYLCAKHDIDSITLKENLQYYSYEPNTLKEIYQKVLDSLDKSYTQMETFVEKRRDLQTEPNSKFKAF